MEFRFERRRCVVAAFAVAALFAPTAVRATPPARADARAAFGSVAGRVATLDGTPVARATLTLAGAGETQRTRSDAAGRFAFAGLRPGTYTVRVEAPGYERLGDRSAQVTADAVTSLDVALARSATSLVTIGRVTANGAETLSTSSAPTTSIDAQRAANDGATKLSDVLQNDIATTLVHPVGGSTVLPTAVALRGPDPTETLIDVDGHQVNSGNTGSFDLSLLDPADYGSVELVRGISPSSLVGPDTIDGAINIRTLEPTSRPHGLLRLTAGSFDSFGETLQSTGTAGRLGYALSLHRTTSAGETNQDVYDVTSGTVRHVGSALDGSTALGRLRYAFGRGDGYVALSFHDQSQFRDLSAALTSIPSAVGITGTTASGDAVARRLSPADGPSPSLLRANAFGGSALSAHNAGYALDAQVPLGAPNASGIVTTTVLYRHYTGLVSQSVVGAASDSSQYLYNDRDLFGDDSLQLQHLFERATVTLQYGRRDERLTTDFPGAAGVSERSIAGTLRAASVATASGTAVLNLTQTQRNAALRATYDPTPAVHLAFATYYSDYSIFGTSLDPRIGFTWTPDARSAVRLSAGSTFQAPQLPALVVPGALPAPVGGYVHIGNPNLRPDHATEYGFGFERVLDAGVHRTSVRLDLYRVNLRTPASTFLPPPVPGCGLATGAPACPLTYPINAGDAVYRGIELEASREIVPFTVVRAGYATRSAFLANVPGYAQTGSLVPQEQTLGLPLQKALVAIDRTPPAGLTFGGRLLSEGAYNELNRPPFAVLDANVGYRFPAFAVQLSATNLTGVYDQRFTQLGAGVPYAGVAGPLATDAYALAGTAITVSVTRRF